MAPEDGYNFLPSASGSEHRSTELGRKFLIRAPQLAVEKLNAEISRKTSAVENMATEKSYSPDPASFAADAGFGAWIPAMRRRCKARSAPRDH